MSGLVVHAQHDADRHATVLAPGIEQAVHRDDVHAFEQQVNPLASCAFDRGPNALFQFIAGLQPVEDRIARPAEAEGGAVECGACSLGVGGAQHLADRISGDASGEVAFEQDAPSRA